ncbi:MAG TPA: TlpA disulfide reductase family protein [Solirubrobacteraceae bacterium]|nr:TlpA disulfide reductase family protein [Solirubrobacteraceae bacterium]
MRLRPWPSIAVALAAALIALLIYGLVTQGPSRALDNAVAKHVYLPAPDASRSLPVLDRIDAADTRLSRWRGQIVVLNFWAQWCSTCIDEVPLIERAQRALLKSGEGTVVGVDYKDISSYALGFISAHGLSYPNIRDEDGSFAAAYGTDALPETFVLDRHMRVVAISRGEVPNEAWLTSAIAFAKRA